MDEVISKLIDIDKKARRRVSKAKKASLKSVELIDEKKAELQKNNDEIFASRITAFKAEKQLQFEEQKRLILQSSESRLSELKNFADENKQQWAESVFRSVIDTEKP